MNAEYDITIDGIVYDVFVDYDYVTDANFGADYDGHRGIKQTSIQVNSLDAWDVSTNKDPDDQIQVTNQEILKQLREEAIEKLSNEKD